MFKSPIKYLLLLSLFGLIISCGKDTTSPFYIVSAAKMIAMTGNDWNTVEPELSNKKDYSFTKFPQPSGDISSVVTMPAIDDSNRTIQGTFILNITVSNKIRYAGFSVSSLTQADAYALMLNYNNETVQNVPDISYSMGDMADSVFMGNTPVTVIVEKLQTGADAEKLAITYNTSIGSFMMVVSKLSDGTYAFGFDGFG